MNRYSAGYIFAVATHAGGPGRVLSQLRDELQEHGMVLSSGFRLQMPSNYVISYDAPSKDEIDANLRQAERIVF